MWEYIILLAILETVFAAHLFVLYPGDHVAVAYALPLLFAVWRFSPLWALGFSVVALALHALDAWMDGTQTLTWGAETLVIASVGALGVQMAERFRTRSRLAARNALPGREAPQEGSWASEGTISRVNHWGDNTQGRDST